MRDKKRQNIQPNQNEPKGSNLNRKRTAEAELDEPYRFDILKLEIYTLIRTL